MGHGSLPLFVIDMDHSPKDGLDEHAMEGEIHGDGVMAATPGKVAIVAHPPDLPGVKKRRINPGQGLQKAPFPREPLAGRFLYGRMDGAVDLLRIGNQFLAELREILYLVTSEKVLFEMVEGPLHFSLRPGPVVLARIEVNAHEAHKLEEGFVIENGTGTLMGDDHLLRIIHDEFQGNTAIKDKAFMDRPDDVRS